LSDLGDEETTGFRLTQRGLQRWKRGIDETTIIDIEIVAEKIRPATATAMPRQVPNDW
jgi:hypothetical protein